MLRGFYKYVTFKFYSMSGPFVILIQIVSLKKMLYDQYQKSFLF